MITTDETVYKDDFNVNNAVEKNYLRILFNGGRSVQVRELNQIQSVLQNQIDKFGSSVYKDGAAVLGGKCTFVPKINSIVFSNELLESFSVVPSEIKSILQGDTPNDIQADVIDFKQDELFTTFYFRYVTGGGTASDGQFDLGGDDFILSPFEVGSASGVLPASDLLDVAGLFLTEGVFFVKGSFVVTPKQNFFIPIEDEINGVSGNAVLDVTESYVTYIQDSTLLDNSTGLPNHLAPGADRYKITLSLNFTNDLADGSDKILLLTIKDSTLVYNTKVRYTDIDRQLAQRTVEESGSYILNPFQIEIDELENSSRPGSEDTNASERIYVGLDPSVAYVDGYRIQLKERFNLNANKARDTLQKEVYISANIGNWIDVTLQPTSPIPRISSSHVTYILYATGSVVIGSTRIRSIEPLGTNKFKLFLYDIQLLDPSYSVADIATITNLDTFFVANATSSLQNIDGDIGIFKLPYNNVRDMSFAANDFSYIIKKTFSGVANGSGQFTIPSLGAGETFDDVSSSNIIVESGGFFKNSPAIVPISPTSFRVDELAPGAATTVIAPVRVVTTDTGTKVISASITDAGLVPDSNNEYTLSKSDIISVSQILISGGVIDVKSDFKISFDGQKSTYYTNGKLKYIGPGTAPTIDATYKHYIHDGLPFTVESYPVQYDETATLGAAEIRYSDIPSYEGTRLSDVIDFRPTILATPGVLSDIQIDPFSTIRCKPTFFLPRIDKVIVSSIGEFKIIEGTPSLEPRAPETPPGTLVLYELKFPAYTFDHKDIEISMIDNRRYTMRDIAKLDKRISKLEYYTSLSLLESATAQQSIFDDLGFQRFKNGMLIDAFTGHGVGDVFNPAYNCSIDRKQQTLRPFFKMNAADLILHSHDSVNLQRNGNTITLKFTETPVVSQLLSSDTESVNPYDVVSFIGSVRLFPTNDSWMEVNRRPDVIINNDAEFDAFRFRAEEQGILGTDWNTWQTSWTGVLSTETINGVGQRVDPLVSRGRLRTITSLQRNQVRTGIQTTVGSVVSQVNQGERIIDVSFVPFIRSRKVYFYAQGLKPNTRVFPSFDGIDISQYCKIEGSVVLPSDVTDVREYLNQNPGDPGFVVPSSLTTDSSGDLIGSFIIPNNNNLKFRTGGRIFRLSDNVTHDRTLETTYADSTYNASGNLQTVEATIVSTRIPHLQRDRVQDSRSVVETVTRWIDPLAQTFLINDIDDGCFLTSLELWFDKKSTSGIPVTIRIVSVENGYPTQRTLPFSEVTLSPDAVSIDGSPTSFDFSDPIFIKGGVEYAIVLISNDPDYRIRVAELGGLDESGTTIMTNPYGGVMFMSQNASTWTADQTRDFKFRLNRAVFQTEEIGEIQFKTKLRTGISHITIVDAGENYAAAPTVTIGAPAPGGGQATAVATIDLVSGQITGIRITDPGFGYTSVPSVSFSGASGAVATAHLFGADVSAFSLIQNAVVHDRTFLDTSLAYASEIYDSIITGYNYLPNAEFEITNATQATLFNVLSSDSEFVSPVVDLDSTTLLCIKNEINSLVSDDETEEDFDGGDAISRYITRSVILNDPADQINLYLDVNRPTEDSNIKVYINVKYDANTNSGWLPIAPERPLIVSTNEEFAECSYMFNSSLDFISFAIKIVFVSANSVYVPTVKNLRVIATS